MTRWLSRSALLLVLLIAAYPFIWCLLSSFKSNREIHQPGNLLPSSFDPFAYRLLFSGDFIDFGEVLGRSLLLSGGQALLATLVCSAAGFALAKVGFRAKPLVFVLALLVILYPRQAMSLSVFDWMSDMGMSGSLFGLLLSGAASGLGVIFFTQVFGKVPDELIDLARIEGRSLGGTFFTLIPLISPALTTFAALHFLLCWQDHLLPLLILSHDQLTLPLALSRLSDSSFRIPQAVGLAAGVLSMIPLLLLFGLSFRRMRTALSEWVVS